MKSIEGFSADFFRNNRKRLRETFGGSATIVITGNSYIQRAADISFPFVQDSSFWYLTGINEPGLILVMETGKTYIIASDRDEIRIAFEGDIDSEEIINISGVDDVYTWNEGWSRLGKKIKKSKHIATVQPSPAYIAHFDMHTNPSRSRLVGLLQEHNDELDLIDISNNLKLLRMVKSQPEIDAIRLAVKETISLISLVEKKRHSVKNTSNLFAAITKQVIDRDIEFSFDTIIATGSNTSVIHYLERNIPLNKNDSMLLDIGVRSSGYCADITRTIIDNPTPRQQQVYDAVLAIQQFAFALLKPGTDLATYEEAVANYTGEKLRELGLIKTITKEAVRKYNPTRTSHFLGIDAHDAGDYDRALEPGVVLAVEPGIYIPAEGIGVRIEDDVVITNEGYENLSAQLPTVVNSLIIRQ